MNRKLTCCSLLALGVLTACDRPTTPALTDENCKPENVDRIEDKKSRQYFTEMCLRRALPPDPNETPRK